MFRKFATTALAVAVIATTALAYPAPAQAVSNSAAFTVSVTAAVTASVAISPSNFTWANVNDSTNQYLAADNNPMTITGSLKTSNTGTATIAVSAPANIAGTTNPALDILNISYLSITCLGAGNTGKNAAPTYAAAKTTLTASASTTCATWGANASVSMNFSLNMYLDDRLVSADTYSSSGFAVVATAS